METVAKARRWPFPERKNIPTILTILTCSVDQAETAAIGQPRTQQAPASQHKVFS